MEVQQQSSTSSDKIPSRTENDYKGEKVLLYIFIFIISNKFYLSENQHFPCGFGDKFCQLFGEQMFSLDEVDVKIHHMLSAKEVLYDSSNTKLFIHSKTAGDSRCALWTNFITSSHSNYKFSLLYISHACKKIYYALT